MKPDSPMPRLLTYKTAAEYLDCSPSKVQKLWLAGQIPGFKLGNETRFRPEDLDAWIERGLHFNESEKFSEDKSSQPIPTKEATHAR